MSQNELAKTACSRVHLESSRVSIPARWLRMADTRAARARCRRSAGCPLGVRPTTGRPLWRLAGGCKSNLCNEKPTYRQLYSIVLETVYTVCSSFFVLLRDFSVSIHQFSLSIFVVKFTPQLLNLPDPASAKLWRSI